MLWTVYVSRRLQTAIHIYAAYFAINYAAFALSADGFRVFLSPWPLLPTICGFYLGGRRLGVMLTTTMVVEAIISAVVNMLGTGHHVMPIPPMDDPSVQAMLGLVVLEILVIVDVFERSRARNHAELGQVLGKLDEQSQTVLSLVENISDAIFLLDDGRHVVTHNHAAAAAFPSLSAGADFLEAMPLARRIQWQQRFDAAARGENVQAEEPMGTAGGLSATSSSRVRGWPRETVSSASPWWRAT